MAIHFLSVVLNLILKGVPIGLIFPQMPLNGAVRLRKRKVIQNLVKKKRKVLHFSFTVISARKRYTLESVCIPIKDVWSHCWIFTLYIKIIRLTTQEGPPVPTVHIISAYSNSLSNLRLLYRVQSFYDSFSTVRLPYKISVALCLNKVMCFIMQQYKIYAMYSILKRRQCGFLTQSKSNQATDL